MVANRSGNIHRHRRNIFGNPIDRITNPAIKRLARRGGIKRMEKLAYNKSREIINDFLERILKDSLAYSEHAKRRTINTSDIIFALKRNDFILYGCEE